MTNAPTIDAEFGLGIFTEAGVSSPVSGSAKARVQETIEYRLSLSACSPGLASKKCFTPHSAKRGIAA